LLRYIEISTSNNLLEFKELIPAVFAELNKALDYITLSDISFSAYLHNKMDPNDPYKTILKTYIDAGFPLLDKKI
jgi:hypothetical protein